jgi:uncharacterized circularly permuted ATP-grasp superfamily protein/uncharacterized alpha-E superfamily protein
MPGESAPAPASLASTYQPAPEGYDEVVTPSGEVRPHWRTFLQHIDELGHHEVTQRWEKARQLLHENGVSYNVYGDPQGTERPWSLSPLPLLLPQRDWTVVEEGISQRARLLDALLRDLYGPQRTLTDGVLPPALILGNPQFLRACHGMHVPRDCWLPLYGVDLVRTPSGQFQVLDDRTQVPSGAGYALENRIIISSTLPEAFRDCNVERLAYFFRALRDLLHSLAPHNRDNPRIVLLTPGPYNATYFEQAYLAQYLGYALVNGADLTVRDDRVYLKTLGGLSQVDVILRRLNDDYCDPLELRPDSVLGVAGLVQAARAGNVAIASPLGTGVLQTPAFLPYMDRLCRALLSEELKLLSVPSYWCGDPEGLRAALAVLDNAVIKPTFPEGFAQPVFTQHLSANDRADMRARLLAEPQKYVVQEQVDASNTLSLDGSRLVPRACATRAFAVAGRDHYVVMPGGLSRVSSGREGTEVSMQLGAGSKDTWIIADAPVSNFSLLPPVDRPVELSRGGADLPSRAADNLYWLGRYAERAEGVARLARVIGARLADLVSEADLQRSTEFAPLLHTLTAQTQLIYTGTLVGKEVTDLSEATEQLLGAVFDPEGHGTLKAVVRATLRAGRLVRDRISMDTWRVLAELDDELNDAADRAHRDPFGTVQDTLNRVVLRLAAFSGVAMESMTRGQAWRFLDMGRRLERAMAMVTLLRGSLNARSEREGPLLEAVLDVADSAMTYRRRYLANLQAAPVVDLLLTDESNPRSVAFQVEALSRHIAALPAPESGLRSPQDRMVLGLLTDLRLADITPLCAADDQGQRTRLSDMLLDLAKRIPGLSDSLSDRYLNHATVSRHLTGDDNSPRAGMLVRGGEP